MAENSKKRKPAEKGWEVLTVGGEKPTYTVPENSYINIGGSSTAPENPPEEEPSPEQKTETAIDELRSRYMAELRSEYENSMNLLREERDEALRENWILQQQTKAALPEQLAAEGINGGATETGLANLGAEYQESRNKIQSDYMNELGELAGKQNEKKAELEKNFMDKWIEYLLGIAKAEKEFEMEKKYG